MTALLPVPVNKLIDDWVLRAQDQQRRITALTRTALADEAEILLQRCTTIVPLYPEGIDATTLSSRAFRQHQYRRLAAILAHMPIMSLRSCVRSRRRNPAAPAR